MEDLTPEWPEIPEEEDPGIYFIAHEVDFPLSGPAGIAQWLQDVISTEGHTLHRIDYVFCTDAYLLGINRAHLGHDDYTDIITFPLNEDPILAEIYISIDRVKENAQEHGVSFHDELCRVMVHGVLHLCGYDDHDEEEVMRMRNREKDHLLKRKS